MSWRDNLRDASFRGVPFKVLNSDVGVGRRNIIHQYPGRDIPSAEDLGEDAAEYAINGYIIQNTGNDFDYFAERDALITALRKKGPDILVHPWLGEKRVVLQGKARITESFEEGGVARFEMTFVQAGENITPETTLDPKQAMDDSAEDATNQIKDEFGTYYVVSGYAIDTAVSDLTKGISMMKRSMTSVKGAVTSTITGAISTINTALTNIGSTVYSACSIGTFLETALEGFLQVIGIPNPITNAVTGICSGVERGDVTVLDGENVPQSLGASLIDSFVALNRFGEDIGTSGLSSYGGALDSITITTENTARESLNRIYTVNALRNLALVNATRIAARISYESYEDAITVMETIVDAIDDQLEELGDQAASTEYSAYGLSFDNSESFNALEDLRSVFIKIMTQIGANLARVIDYKVPPEIYTTLEVAYNEYNDVTRESEIYERNKLAAPHPGFLPAGRTIEILSE
jgi:prophage DNA circulation protein